MVRVLVLLAGLIVAPLATAAERDAADPAAAKVQNERWMTWYAQAARNDYEFTVGTEPPAKLALAAEPLLKFSNPVTTGGLHGAVYLWTHNGRPAVVGQLFSYIGSKPDERVICHSFQSLAQRPVVGRREGEVFWSPDKPGVTLEPLPGAPAPAANRAGRLRQMRALARQFVVKTEETTGEREQRLLPQPLYRIAQPADGVEDEALFAFVTGTDPEAFLLLTACPTPGGPVWYFGLTRATLWPLYATVGEREVWRVERMEQGRGRDKQKQLYLSTHGVLVRPALLSAEEIE